jgi:hypothetical protein
MPYEGTVQNGMVVLHGSLSLPDGTVVAIVPMPSPPTEPESRELARREEQTVWQKLTELGRWAETQPTDLPSDLAVNHDHYLHGLPKRQ